VWGLLLSVVAAAIAFSLVPPSYSSTGTAVLVQPKPSGQAPLNPLLSADTNLTTTTLILVQELSDPSTAGELGLPAGGPDTYNVKWGGSVAVTDAVQQPFISVVAWSPSATNGEAIVANVLERGRQELADRQKSLRVSTRSAIKLTNVVGPTPSQPVRGKQLAAAGMAILCCLALTGMTARCVDRREARRTARAQARLPGEGQFSVERLANSWPVPEATSTTNGHATLATSRTSGPTRKAICDSTED
jgi:hypothetical protein